MPPYFDFQAETRRGRHAVLAADIRHAHAGLLLPENADDLFLGEPAALHSGPFLSVMIPARRGGETRGQVTSSLRDRISIDRWGRPCNDLSEIVTENVLHVFSLHRTAGQYMVFAKRSKLAGTIWLALNPLKTEIGRKASLAVIVAIPAMAAINSNLESYRASNDSILNALLNIIERDQIDIPLNLLRTFWASALFYVASIFYQIGTPSILGSYENWSRSADYFKLKCAVRSGQKSISEGELEERLKSTHRDQTVPFISFDTFALICAIITACLSAYLVILVVLLNMIRVWEACSIETVFSFGSNSCHAEEKAL